MLCSRPLDPDRVLVQRVRLELKKRVSRSRVQGVCLEVAAVSNSAGEFQDFLVPVSVPVFEPLEPRLLLSSSVVMTEFMADNVTTLADGDGLFSDWIELHNTTADPVDLDGWYLTDDESVRIKWQFPAVTIDPGGKSLPEIAIDWPPVT